MINKDHQTEKTAYIMIPFIGNLRGKKERGGKAIRKENRPVFTRVWEWEEDID